MKSISRINPRWLLAVTLILAQLWLAGGVGAQALPPQNPSQFDVTGFIQAATLDNPLDPLSGGTITVNNQVITVPANTILQMPAAALTWQQVFASAPPPYGPTQTGLAMNDTPEPLNTYEAHVVGNRVGDVYIAGLMFLAQHSLQSGQGFINFIDYSTGEFRVGGTIGDATTGQRVKINDPDGKFGRTWTPDSRFTIDEGNPTIRSETGYPMCIPRGPAADGDALCPQANRPLDVTSPSGFAMILTMPAPAAVFPGGPDPRLMAPFEVGDYVTYSGILVADPAPATTTYIAAFAVTGNVGLYTAPGTDPAYIATDVLLLGVGGQTVAGLAEATVRTRFEGFTTDPSRNVLLFGVDVDACSGAETLRPWGAIGVDPGPPNGAVMGRWRFRPPCTAATPTDKACTPPPAGSFLPAPREMVSAIETAPGSGVPAQPFLVSGVALPGSNLYQAPIFEFLFPENAGTGNPVVPNNFEDMPFLLNGSGPLEPGGPIVGRLNPWPLGLSTPLAPPAVCKFPLSVVAAGNGSGTVTPVPAGTSPLFDYGSVVTLTATPTLGSTFTGWSGACTGTGTCTVTMTQAQTVTATFTLQQFALSVVAAGTGSGTVSPVAVGSSSLFNFGSVVTLTATPAVGSVLTGWSGGGCTGTASCTVTVTAATTVTATFGPAKAALLSPTPGSTLPGAAVTFTWSAGSGATEYILWVGTTAGHNQLYSKSQGLNLSVTVPNLPINGAPVFVRLFTRFGTTLFFTDYTFTAATQFPLSVVAAGTGTGTVSPVAAGSSAAFDAGTAVTLTATPAVGSLFTGWTGSGCTGTAACTVTVTAATTVTATFTSAKAALLSPTPGSTLPGAAVTFNWSAGTGATEYLLWVGTTAGHNQLYSKSQGLNLSVTVPNLPINGAPVFVRLFTRFGTTLLFTDYTFTAATQFPLSVVAAGTGTGTVSPVAAGSSAAFDAGTAVTLTATPAVGSLFTGWTGSGCTGTAACTVTVTAATTVTATFTSAKAALLSPTPGSTLPGAAVTFNWSAGTGATEYILWVGTTAGHNQLYSKSQGLNLSVTVPNLPSGGVPVFVRLFTRVGTTLLFTDYTFTAAP